MLTSCINTHDQKQQAPADNALGVYENSKTSPGYPFKFQKNKKTMTEDREYKKLRDEWASGGLVRSMAERTLGRVCYNCGSDECIELHHVVPLKLGGTNNLSNIVVLCHRCHCAAHNGRHIKDYQNKEVTGRPHNVETEELDKALNEYVIGQIGSAECKARMGLSQKTKIGDMSYYKRFKKDHGIKKVKNNIDIILNKRGEVEKGENVGYIEYEDGRKEVNVYGINSNN